MINDDVLIEQMLSGRNGGTPSDISPFISVILAKFLSTLYIHIGTSFNLFGTILLIVNFMILIIVLNLIFFLNNFQSYIFGFGVIALIIPTLIIAPTFTITSILATGMAMITLIIYHRNGGVNLKFIYLNLLLMVFGYLIRPEAFVGCLILIGPLLIAYILTNKNLRLKQILYFLFIFGLLFTGNWFIRNYFFDRNLSYNEYFDFVSIRGSLSYTPAIYKIHQLILENLIYNSPWKNVDFIIMQNWHHVDKLIFNSINLEYVYSFVNNYVGINGVIKSDLNSTILRILSETKELFIFIFLFIIFFLAKIFFIKDKLKFFIYNFLIFFALFINFYYLAAVARLPYRTTFPMVIILLTSLLFQNAELNKKLGSKLNLLFIFVFFIALIQFHINNDFGFKKIIGRNMNLVETMSQRDLSFVNFQKQNKIIIAPIDYLPISILGTFKNNLFFSSGSATVSLDWTVNSPNWDSKLESLGLDSSNLFNSLAKKKNVYYAGTSEMAQIINFYMNDHNIFRGKLCKVNDLNGLEIYTYQAKVNDC